MYTNNTHHRPSTSSTTTSRARFGAAVALVSLAFAACGSSDDSTGAEAAAAPAPPATAPPTVADAPEVGAVAKSTSSSIGDVLTDAAGLTLYGFTNDVDATSTCDGTCADAWPPVIVPADFEVGPGLDVGIFATTTRDDGQTQLVAGRFPLYTFAGDAVPGDVKGQASGDVWFAVDPSGVLHDDPAPVSDSEGDSQEAVQEVEEEAEAASIVSVQSTDAGDVLADSSGLSLYGFLNDEDGEPTCDDDCADAWPPVIVEGAELPAGLDADVFSVAERADGTFQLKAGVWPLYRFAADSAPGDIEGQGSGDVWFLAAPDGGLVKS